MSSDPDDFLRKIQPDNEPYKKDGKLIGNWITFLLDEKDRVVEIE